MKNIKSYILIILLSTMGAQVVTVQGVLRDNNNAAISDGTYEMTFEIFDSQSGGASLWSTVGEDVTVINGVYSLGLNIGTSLQSSGSELWLEVTVNGDTMNERVRLHISPYEQMILQGDSNVFPGSGSVGIGTTNPDPSTKLDVRGDVTVYEDTDGVTTMQIRNVNQALNISSTHETGVAQYSTIETGGHHLLLNPDGGNVGVGVSNPDYALTVAGGAMGTTFIRDLDDPDTYFLDPSWISEVNGMYCNNISADYTDFNNSISADDIGNNAVGEAELHVDAGRPQGYKQLCSGSDCNGTGYYECNEGAIYNFTHYLATTTPNASSEIHISLKDVWGGETSFTKVGISQIRNESTSTYETNTLTIPCPPGHQLYYNAFGASDHEYTFWTAFFYQDNYND